MEIKEIENKNDNNELRDNNRIVQLLSLENVKLLLLSANHKLKRDNDIEGYFNTIKAAKETMELLKLYKYYEFK